MLDCSCSLPRARVTAAVNDVVSLAGGRDTACSFPFSSQSMYRKQVYSDNLDLINKHNAQAQNEWRMSRNAFADLTSEEWTSLVSEQTPPIGCAGVDAAGQPLADNSTVVTMLDDQPLPAHACSDADLSSRLDERKNTDARRC